MNALQEERFDVVDISGNPTGETVSRAVAHAEGIRHRTAHIWVARRRGASVDVLLQKRSADKDSNPNCWDTSSAGHIDAGEEPLPSALRELREELGIEARESQLRYLGLFAHRDDAVFYGKPFRDDEISFVYLYTDPVELAALKLQAEEVQAVDWFQADEVLRALENGDTRFCLCPDGLKMVVDFINAKS